METWRTWNLHRVYDFVCSDFLTLPASFFWRRLTLKLLLTVSLKVLLILFSEPNSIRGKRNNRDCSAMLEVSDCLIHQTGVRKIIWKPLSPSNRLGMPWCRPNFLIWSNHLNWKFPGSGTALLTWNDIVKLLLWVFRVQVGRPHLFVLPILPLNHAVKGLPTNSWRYYIQRLTFSIGWVCLLIFSCLIQVYDLWKFN